MLDSLAPLLNHLPPKTVKALQQAIMVCGRQVGMAPDWVQRWVAFTLVADALAEYAPDGTPAFQFKGGAAIEMRLRQPKPASRNGAPSDGFGSLKPRATKDLDATFRGELDAVITAVEGALSTTRHGFRFHVTVDTPDAPRIRRFRVHVAYLESIGQTGQSQDRDFAKVKLEVSAYEGTPLPPDLVPAFSLKPFGIDGPAHLPCIPLVKQVAQKIHAVTEVPGEGKTNDRFRDLVDLVMLSGFEPPSSQLRAVCEETFAIRQGHRWPPDIVTYEHWHEPMERLAQESGLESTASTEIVSHVQAYVRSIAEV